MKKKKASVPSFGISIYGRWIYVVKLFSMVAPHSNVIVSFVSIGSSYEFIRKKKVSRIKIGNIIL